MRGDTHVRFGGRARETDPGQPGHRARARPNRTLATLQRHCRIRSYLVSARNHGRRPMDAIRDALTANPWMPPQAA